MAHYDLIVIGTGSGNTIVDEEFAEWSVAIVEERTFGGTCLNRGCIPSKMFVHPADLLEDARAGRALGARTQAAGADWEAVRRRVFARIDRDADAGRRDRTSQPNVEVLTGRARFTGPRALRVDLETGGRVEVSGTTVVIAAGSRPVVPDIDGLAQLHAATLGPSGDVAEGDYHTSDTVMRMPTLPHRLGIVGGGYVGAEFAHVFGAYGSRVTWLDTGGLLLNDEDHDIAERFTEVARRRWDVHTRTRLRRVRRAEGGLLLHLDGPDGERRVEVDALLLAVGRVPNGDRLDVARAGVAVDGDGVVVVDEHLRTTADGVWALGDVATHTPLKHAANQDARVVRHNLLHPDDLRTADRDDVPHAVFTAPQIAAVGLTETAARERGLDLAVAVQEYGDTAYGWAMEDDDHPGGTGPHVVKLLADRRSGLLVGAHLIGPQASVLVQSMILAISHRIPVRGFARSQYWIHPALTEVVEQAFLALEDALDRP